MKVRKRETPELRKNQIIAAADLVLLSVGIERFTVDQVIEKAGIAKGTVYNYFKNKDEMLAVLCEKALMLLLQTFNDSVKKERTSIEKIKAVCLAHYSYTKKYPAYSELISYVERPEFDIHVQHYVKISHEITDYVAQIIREGQERGEIRLGLDPYVVTYITWATNVGVVQFVESKKKLLNRQHEISTEQMVKSFAEMITMGITA